MYNRYVNERSKNLFLHADGDSFFVACELSRRPELRGKPVVVGEDRGIAVAMSYEAKKLGVTRGMPVFQMKKQFPEVIMLSHHFGLYREISDKVYDILNSYLDVVEVYSIDECFAEVRPSDLKFFGGPEKLAHAIKDEIQQTLGVTYSFGIARTKALAKTASKLNKPNGMVILLDSEAEIAALKKTAVDDVWGIGRRTTPRLVSMGMKTAYDFIRYPSEKIEQFFSEPLLVLQKELQGESLHELHNDSDPRDQKSIQSTATFRPPSSDKKIIWAEISENAENACEHARRLDLMTNSVSFFVKTTDFSYRSADARLELFTTDPGMILNALESLLANVLKSGEKIRSTGVILHNLRRIEDVPSDLFGAQERVNARGVVETVADALRRKFGHDAVKRAASLHGSGKEKDNSFPKHGF